jgi:hypothetical protein
MHVSGALGSCPTGTIIDNPLCNDDPNAMLFVTTNFTPDGSLTNSVNGGVYGVQFLSAFQFGCTCGKWAIVNLNTSYNYQCLASNSAFNVLVIKQ